MKGARVLIVEDDADARQLMRRILEPLGVTVELAASAALGMAGALYVSVRLEEDWLREALYLITFIALAFTGPGKFSVDHLLARNKTPATS